MQDSICCGCLGLAACAEIWFLGWRLARAGSWSSLIQQAQIAAASDCSAVEAAARRVIPCPLLVAAGGRCPRLIRFFGRLWVDVLGFLGAQFPNSPF